MIEKILLATTIVAGLGIGATWSPHQNTTFADVPHLATATLSRSGDGHFYTEAKVNGRSIRFLVDTGASETALTEEDAKRLGISLDRSAYEFVGKGASGIVRGQWVQLESIVINDIERSDVRALVLEGGSVSLLGQPFLQTIDEILIKSGEMEFKTSHV
jgi:aspartyl protease family protein